MKEMARRCQAYASVAKAIGFIRQSARAQPTLDQIAAHVGMSPFHLQRVFSDWAGISPKRFLQFLTREHARSLLKARQDVLAVALETGLSGPGRLHDLMVACDAATPGEIRALGAGLTIRYGFAATPFGRVIAGVTGRGLCHLQFTADEGSGAAAQPQPSADAAAFAALAADWPLASLVRDDEAVAAIVEAAFAGAGASGPPGPLHVLLRGTNFQIKVWQALLDVHGGEVVSYQGLAARMGAPRATRAVASAVAANRIAVLIPCHRVIRESGEIGGYRWGSERKQALLACEAAAAR